MTDEMLDRALFVNCFYDQGVAGVHPRTGEAVTPPVSAVFVCMPETEPQVRSILSWLLSTYQWSGEITTERIAGTGAGGL